MSGKKTRYDITGNGTTVLSFASGLTSTGVIFYIRIPGKDIHLVYCLNNGIIDVHVKVNGKMIWRKTLLPEELEQRVLPALKRCLKKHHANQKMYTFGQHVTSVMLSPYMVKEGSNIHEIDLIKLSKIVMADITTKGIFEKIRIKDARARGIPFGFVLSKSQMCAVIPLGKGYCLEFNLSRRRGIWAALPMVEGIDVLMKHLDKEGILDEQFEKAKEPLSASLKELKLMAEQIQ